MLQNLAIAQQARLKPIVEIAAALRIEEDELELYGRYKAKIALSILRRLASRPNGKYIDVTSITPTPLGEGKTTTTVGLSMALNRTGSRRSAPRSASRAVPPAGATPRWCRWRTSTCT